VQCQLNRIVHKKQEQQSTLGLAHHAHCMADLFGNPSAAAAQTALVVSRNNNT
jgi:hypothetical protein